MKNTKKIIYVLASATLALLVGCNNNNVSESSNVVSSSSQVSESSTVSESSSSIEKVYGPWTLMVTPTETTNGIAMRTCETDGTTETKIVPNLLTTTTWSVEHKKEPTCEETGLYIYTSTEYGVVESVVAPLGHKWGKWTITVRPTLEAEGEATRTCGVDGAVDTTTVPALSNEEVWEVEHTKASTPFEEGIDTYTSEDFGTVTVTLEKIKLEAGDAVVRAKPDDATKVELIAKSADPTYDVFVGDPIKEMTVKKGATYSFETSETYPWTQSTENAHSFTSGGKGVGSSTSTLTITATSSGILTFNYKVSSEARYDKLIIKKINSTSNFKELSGEEEGTVSFDVNEGDTFNIMYTKDSSGNRGDDQATITFVEVKEYTYNALNFVTNGGSACKPLFIENGKLVGELPETTKDGYYFEGWYTDEALETKYDDSVVFEGDAKLYAKWSEAQEVTFVTFEGDTATIDPVKFQIGTAPVIDVEASRDGYYFLGWYTDPDCQNAYEGGTADESFTLYAKWIAESEANPLFGNYGGFYVTDNSTSATAGYTEASIDTDGNFSIRIYYSGYLKGKITNINSDGTVTFENATGDSGNVSAMFYDSETGTLFVKFKDSSNTKVYILNRKYSGPTAEGVKTAYTSLVQENDSTAKLIATSYIIDGEEKTVAFNMEDFDVLPNVVVKDENGNAIAVTDITNHLRFTVDQGEVAVTLYESSTGKGYVAWSDGYDGIYTSSDDKTLNLSGAGYAITDLIGSNKAKYEVLSENEIYVYYSSTIRYLVTVNKTAKTFSYEVRKVTVTYNFGYEEAGVTKTATQELVYDCWDDIDCEPGTREGYTFDGWFDNPEFTGSATTRASLKEDTTYYAKWIANKTISFKDSDGNSVGNNAVVGEGKTLSSSAVPTIAEKDGYYWDGWYTDQALTEPFDFDTAITTDITLYGEYKENVSYSGSFVGFNLCGSGKHGSTANASGSYTTVLDGSGLGTSGKLKDYAVSSLDGTAMTLEKNGSNAYLAYSVYNDVYVLVFPFSQPGSTYEGRMTADNAFIVQASNASFKVTNLDTKIWVVNVILSETNSFNVLVDSDKLMVKAGVTFEDFSGNALTFDEIYANGAYANELLIKDSLGAKVARYKLVSGSYIEVDDFAGTYTGTIDGVNATITLNGYKGASVVIDGADAAEGSYSTVTENDVTTLTVKYGSVTKSFVMGTGNTLSQVLDGVKGTYTCGTSTIVLTGWGVASVDGVAGTYNITGEFVKVTVGDVSTFYTLDKDNDTATVATLSAYAGLTYSGKYYNEWDECDTEIRIVFNQSAAIEGTIYSGYSENFHFEFTGVESEGKLTLTLTIVSGVTSDLNGKTMVLTIGDKTLTYESGNAYNNAYSFNRGFTVTAKE